MDTKISVHIEAEGPAAALAGLFANLRNVAATVVNNGSPAATNGAATTAGPKS